MESVPKDAGSPWTGFTWEKTLYPDPPAFLKALHDKGLVVSLNNHPHDGIRYFEDTYKQVCEHMGRDPKEKLVREDHFRVYLLIQISQYGSTVATANLWTPTSTSCARHGKTKGVTFGGSIGSRVAML